MQKLSQVNSTVQGANDGVRRHKKEARKAVLDDLYKPVYKTSLFMTT